MLNTPLSPWPSLTVEEANAVSEMLLSNKVNYWTGQECREFEKEFAAWCKVPHAIALANGTLALDLCWKTLGIGAGDEVIVTPRTFLASASSIIMAGAIPVFADVDSESGNITPESAARVISARTKAILLVHLAGWPCDMTGFVDLAKSHHLHLVEDCAQAHGAAWKGVPVGSQSAISAWSFCQDKIMTTGGEGGMVTTNSQDLWSRGWSFKDHGKSWDAVYERKHPPGYRWVHESIGTNWRMLEMQGVIGRIQLKRMADWTARRTANATAILTAAQNFSVVRVPEIAREATHAHYKTYCYVRPEALKTSWSRDRIVAEVSQRGVPCFQGSCSEIYLEKAFDHGGFRPGTRLPMARELGETSLMFLVHPTLTEAEIHLTTQVMGAVLSEAQR